MVKHIPDKDVTQVQILSSPLWAWGVFVGRGRTVRQHLCTVTIGGSIPLASIVLPGGAMAASESLKLLILVRVQVGQLISRSVVQSAEHLSHKQDRRGSNPLTPLFNLFAVYRVSA
jgi:hypothetical protein